jgi:hypothetical protein
LKVIDGSSTDIFTNYKLSLEGRNTTSRFDGFDLNVKDLIDGIFKYKLPCGF